MTKTPVTKEHTMRYEVKKRPARICRTCGEQADYELYDERQFLRGFYCYEHACARADELLADSRRRET